MKPVGKPSPSSALIALAVMVVSPLTQVHEKSKEHDPTLSHRYDNSDTKVVNWRLSGANGPWGGMNGACDDHV